MGVQQSFLVYRAGFNTLPGDRGFGAPSALKSSIALLLVGELFVFMATIFTRSAG